MSAKRTFDLAVALAGLLFLAPLMIATAAAVWLSLGWPILYSPTRTGLNGTLFTLRKFRTMKNSVGAPPSHHSGDDDPRITRCRIVRKLKLDELPQLWNVVKGEMSLVGPRPETPDYTKLYSEDQMAILSVRPGITDFASIEFANLGELLRGDDPDKLYFEKVWDRKMELRMKYVRERSFWGDLRLICRTVFAVVRR